MQPELSVGLVALAASIITAVVAWLTSRDRTTTDATTSLVTALHTDNAELRTRVESLQDHVEECETANAELRAQVAALKIEATDRDDRITRLERALRSVFDRADLDQIRHDLEGD